MAPEILETINAGLPAQCLLLQTSTLVDPSLIASPGSARNRSGERDPAMHQTKKGDQWHFGMKAYIGVDAESSMVHGAFGTAANVYDATLGGSTAARAGDQCIHGRG